MTQTLALFGGSPAIPKRHEDVFAWPLLDDADERAVLDALRTPDLDDPALIASFETQFAAWVGAAHAVAESSATNALLAGMFACGVGAGDEVIVPPCTYWATCTPILNLRATPVFADIDRETMNISSAEISRCLTPRTRAIVVTHLFGYPCDMDAILQVASARGIRVIEDASHALGSLYRGKQVGTIGDVGVFSIGRKGLAVGEGGMLVTNDRIIHDRVVAWGHAERFHSGVITDPELLRYVGVPLGGITSRMHILSAALGLSQLCRLDERLSEISEAMNDFWDQLKGVPGLRAHRPAPDSGLAIGTWYNPHGLYLADELGGLALERFIAVLAAEGFQSWTWGGLTRPLHLHPLFQVADVYREGAPTAISRAERDTRSRPGSLPVAESIRALAVPAFRRFCRKVINSYASAFRKVSEAYASLGPHIAWSDA
jgi:dTDP-4-amino-4,6-dideoxygalactose transaminase